MKIEIEISEKDIKDYVEQYFDQNLRKSYVSYDFKKFLEDHVKAALSRSFAETDFMTIIEKNCREIAIKEIDKAANQKVPGWVARQMKEMLKYARASFWEVEAKAMLK